MNGTTLRSGLVLASLIELRIGMISGLAKLHEGFVHSLRGLQVLEINYYEGLTCFWDDNGDGFGSENLNSFS